MRFVILLVLTSWSVGVSGQTLVKATEWNAPSTMTIAGVRLLSDGSVAIWTRVGDLTVLDDQLRPIADYVLEPGIASVRRVSSGALEVLMAAPPRLIRVGEGLGGSVERVAGLEDHSLIEATSMGRMWYAIARGPGLAETALLRFQSNGGDPVRVSENIPDDAHLSVVGMSVAVSLAGGPMSIDFVDAVDQRVSLTPKRSVLDSLTYGSLGVARSEWTAGPALPFFDGGVVQPIMDAASERTIMMIYSAEGVPVGWPVIRGAVLEAFAFNPDDGTMLGLVEHDGRRTIQKLVWRRER